MCLRTLPTPFYNLEQENVGTLEDVLLREDPHGTSRTLFLKTSKKKG